MEETAQQKGLASRIGGWLSEPFKTDMDIVAWFAFTGLILCFVIFWGLILKIIVEGVEP